MSYTSNVVRNAQTVEYGKFVEIKDDSRFPAISVVRTGYYDDSSAFPGNTGSPTYSAVDIYPKYAVLAYVANTDEFAVTLSAGQVNLDTAQMEYHLSNLDTSVSASNQYLNAIELNTFDTASAADDIYHALLDIKNEGSQVSFLQDSGNTDAFGRLRTSMPTTLFDSKTLHSKSSLFWSQTASSGASVYFTSELNDASVTLSATGAGQYAIRQTTQRFNYQPGKSQLAIFTGVMTPVTNAIKRYGLFQSLTAAPFEPNVGLYFETQTDSPSSIAVVQQNDGFLVPSVSARREDWNIDKLDGTGPSGKVLSLSAANIFLVDYEWLGVGRVRFGTVIDGAICYCHAINNAGNVQGAYIRTPNLPVRAEVRQNGAGSASMKMICSSVMSEGGADFTGVTRAVSVSGYPGLVIGTGVRRAIIGVRLQANKLDSVNEMINASAMVIPQGASNQASFQYELIHNPVVTGGFWTTIQDSNFEYWQGQAAATGGTVVASGYASVGAAIDVSNQRFEKFLRMGCSVNGVRDEMYLVITPLNNNDGVYGAITFVESD
jgi:hypothetical protein